MFNFLLLFLLSIFTSRKSEIGVYFIPSENPDSIQVLIFTSFNRNSLYFLKDKDGYKASLELQVEIFKSKREILWGNNWYFDILVQSAKEARSSYWYHRFYLVSMKREEKLEVRGRLKDNLGNVIVDFERKCTAPSLVSDPIPLDEDALAEGQKRPKSAYLKEKEIVLYVKSLSDSIPFSLDLVDINSVKGTRGVLKKGDNYVKLSLEGVRSGNYDLVLKAGIDMRKIPVTVYTLPLDFADKEFNQLLLILSFLFPSEELDTLEKFKNNKDSLEAYWSRFWKRRDPTPETEFNEFEEEFWERLEYADRNFGSHLKRGALSDRGLCYIALGPPDEIERHPFDLESPSYEVWRYYNLNYRFVFVDLKGVGDYEVVDPPKYVFCDLLKRYRQ